MSGPLMFGPLMRTLGFSWQPWSALTAVQRSHGESFPPEADSYHRADIVLLAFLVRQTAFVVPAIYKQYQAARRRFSFPSPNERLL